jgi:hypothetical protein
MAPQRRGRAWSELADYAVFFPGTLAESVLELDALCRRRERETGVPHPTVSCDELGAEHLSFTLHSREFDPKTEGLELFERLARRSARVGAVACVASGPGFARFRVSYRSP